MDQTQRFAIYPQIGYIGTWAKTVVRAFQPRHMPYHEIHHFSTSINLRGCHFPLRGQTPVSQPTTHQPRLVDSSSLRTFCPCLYYQAIEQTFQDPSIFEPVSLEPTSLVTSLVSSLQQQHGKHTHGQLVMDVNSLLDTSWQRAKRPFVVADPSFLLSMPLFDRCSTFLPDSSFN